MAREGTTLEEEHRRSCRSKAALAIARVWGARETRWQRLQVGFGIGDEFVPTPAQMEEVHEYMRVLREEEIAYEALEAQYEDDEAREARHEQREFQEQRMRDEAGEDEDEDDRVVEV
ncbi:hypothetical protein MMC18_001899 [Xylographa bjoerkii]|nr:hypothetical protein [Xylographa bjoerkii]